MHTVYKLRRKPDGSSGFNVDWSFVNRLTDGKGQTLLTGVTPNRYFKEAVTFKDPNERDAVIFSADRKLAPRAFVLKNMSGEELFRIELPIGVRLRPNAPLSFASAMTGNTMEVLPAHTVTSNELNRLVSVFVSEFVVKFNGESIAYSGRFNPEDADSDFAKSTVTALANDALTDIKSIPRKFMQRKHSKLEDQEVGKLTVRDNFANPEMAMTLLLFRTYIFKHLQSPEQRWWQE